MTKRYLCYKTDDGSATQGDNPPDEDQLQAVANGDLDVFVFEDGNFSRVDEDGEENRVDVK